MPFDTRSAPVQMKKEAAKPDVKPPAKEPTTKDAVAGANGYDAQAAKLAPDDAAATKKDAKTGGQKAAKADPHHHDKKKGAAKKDEAKKDEPKPEPAPAPAAAAPRVVNATYTDATNYVERFFRRSGEMGGLLVDAMEGGFNKFKITTSADYNRSSSMGMALFELALAAVPAAGVLVGALAELKGGAQTVAAIKKIHHAVEAASKVTEGVDKVKGAVDKGKEVAKSGDEASEGKEMGDFQIETITSLGELNRAAVAARWSKEDVVVGLLRALEYAPATVDIEAIVMDALGAMPNVAALGAAIEPASDQFELQLYNDYFITSGRAMYETIDSDGQIMHEWHGLPPGVEKRCQAMGWESTLINNPKLKTHFRRHTYSGRMQ